MVSFYDSAWFLLECETNRVHERAPYGLHYAGAFTIVISRWRSSGSRRCSEHPFTNFFYLFLILPDETSVVIWLRSLLHLFCRFEFRFSLFLLHFRDVSLTLTYYRVFSLFKITRINKELHSMYHI